MAPLLSPLQLTALRSVAEAGMITPVTIARRKLTDSAYGDDEDVGFTTVGVVNGWLFSRPTAVAVTDDGSLVTSNTYRLFVPVGTDVLAGDRLTIGGEEYTVSDTTAESTWLPLTSVSLRRRE